MSAMNIRDNTFFTCSRKLEQFLFIHGIYYQGFHKDGDGQLGFMYEATSELQRVVAEWEEIQGRKERMRI